MLPSIPNCTGMTQYAYRRVPQCPLIWYPQFQSFTDNWNAYLKDRGNINPLEQVSPHRGLERHKEGADRCEGEWKEGAQTEAVMDVGSRKGWISRGSTCQILSFFPGQIYLYRAMMTCTNKWAGMGPSWPIAAAGAYPGAWQQMSPYPRRPLPPKIPMGWHNSQKKCLFFISVFQCVTWILLNFTIQ